MFWVGFTDGENKLYIKESDLLRWCSLGSSNLWCIRNHMLCALVYSCKLKLKLPMEDLVPVSSVATGKTPFISVVQGEVCNNHNYKLKAFGFKPKPHLSFCRFAVLKMQVLFFFFSKVSDFHSFLSLLLPHTANKSLAILSTGVIRKRVSRCLVFVVTLQVI